MNATGKFHVMPKSAYRDFFLSRSIHSRYPSHKSLNLYNAYTSTSTTIETTARYGDNVIADIDSATGVVVRTYVTPFLDSNVSMTIAGATPTTYYYNQDERWNVVNLTDSTGTAVNFYLYSGFGDTVGVMREIISQRFKYTGRERSRTSGLDFLRYRWHSTPTGSFMSRDPWGYVDGPSLYSAYLSSLFSIDPSGTRVEVLIGVGSHDIDWGFGLAYNHDPNFRFSDMEEGATLADMLNAITNLSSGEEDCCVKELAIGAHGDGDNTFVGGLDKNADGSRKYGSGLSEAPYGLPNSIYTGGGYVMPSVPVELSPSHPQYYDNMSSLLTQSHVLNASTAALFGIALMNEVNFCDDAVIYFHSCYMGLSQVAGLLAKYSGVTVIGCDQSYEVGTAMNFVNDAGPIVTRYSDPDGIGINTGVETVRSPDPSHWWNWPAFGGDPYSYTSGNGARPFVPVITPRPYNPFDIEFP